MKQGALVGAACAVLLIAGCGQAEPVPEPSTPRPTTGVTTVPQKSADERGADRIRALVPEATHVDTPTLKALATDVCTLLRTTDSGGLEPFIAGMSEPGVPEETVRALVAAVPNWMCPDQVVAAAAYKAAPVPEPEAEPTEDPADTPQPDPSSILALLRFQAPSVAHYTDEELEEMAEITCEWLELDPDGGVVEASSFLHSSGIPVEEAVAVILWGAKWKCPARVSGLS